MDQVLNAQIFLSSRSSETLQTLFFKFHLINSGDYSCRSVDTDLSVKTTTVHVPKYMACIQPWMN